MPRPPASFVSSLCYRPALSWPAALSLEETQTETKPNTAGEQDNRGTELISARRHTTLIQNRLSAPFIWMSGTSTHLICSWLEVWLLGFHLAGKLGTDQHTASDFRKAQREDSEKTQRADASRSSEALQGPLRRAHRLFASILCLFLKKKAFFSK